jgi:hypothetical protein
MNGRKQRGGVASRGLVGGNDAGLESDKRTAAVLSCHASVCLLFDL